MKILELVCQKRNIDFTIDNNHVRYMAHIINLAAQAAFSCLKVPHVPLIQEGDHLLIL